MKVKTFLGFVAIILAAVIVVVCGIGSSVNGEWFKNGNVYTWFNSWGQNGQSNPDGSPDDGAEQPDDIPPITDDGSAELENGEQNGVQLLSAKIPRVAYELNEISPQADTAFTLTATVEPSDAVNKVVDWSVAWENEQSSWANGKEVTDYVTVTPTTDGALTARATCMQAFGEKVIITAQVRDGSDDLKATCVANYVQRFLGANFKFLNHYDKEDPKYDYSWSFTTDNLNPEIDLLQYTSPWIWLLYSKPDNYSYEVQPRFSTVYTKALPAGLHAPTMSFTTEYLTAVRAAGLTPKLNAGVNMDMENDFAVVDIFFPVNPRGTLPSSSSNWNAYRNSLKSNAGKTMFKLKCVSMFSVDDIRETVYEVKISSRSLDQLATNISLNRDEIDF